MRQNGIILTVDDSPSEKFDVLLDYLNEHGIGAILFCRGDYLEQRREFALRAIKERFIIGNHSYDHSNFRKPHTDAKQQITQTDRIIDTVYAEARTARPTKYFRYPYGQSGDAAQRAASQKVLQELGYRSPLYPNRFDWAWDVQLFDWKVEPQNVGNKLNLARTRLNDLKTGHVLLTHDHSKNLEVQLFQQICQAVMNLGLRFLSNDELLKQACVTLLAEDLRENT